VGRQVCPAHGIPNRRSTDDGRVTGNRRPEMHALDVHHGATAAVTASVDAMVLSDSVQ